MKRQVLLILGIYFSLTLVCAQKQTEITVAAGKPLFEIKPEMWGVFFEDINFAADGGMYAELVKNRSFEFTFPLMGWRQVRNEATGRAVPTFYVPERPSNPHYVTIYADAPEGTFGLVNEGFRGMGVKGGVRYDFSVMLRISDNSDLKLTVQLSSHDNKVLGSAQLSGFTGEWARYSASITPEVTDPEATLSLLFTGRGAADIDMVSLFPSDTWKGRQGGLRKDIVTMIADLKPGFLRFPGGCIVEGRDLTNRYQWKNSVGPADERRMIINRWNMEMRNRQAPDYYQSFGLGFYEYFLLAEDIGAEPLPILNCGMSCQFNAGEVVPLSELDQYIEDALDLIEFANGSTETEWGSLRASMGHPEPFSMKYIGVGNEQWEEQYIERYREFESVLIEKHPEIMIVAGSGPSASGRYFEYAWAELKKLRPSLMDEHYYMPPEWFQSNAARYDTYERGPIKVFAGEYAAHGREAEAPESRNSWLSALSEAAFMTGLERNADIVHMASYAPLLAHTEAWQWRPDLIWFDNLRVMGTPNYYVQKLFSNNKGTHVLAASSSGKPLTGVDSLYASATIDQNDKLIIIKVINTASAAQKISLSIEGKTIIKEGEIETLRSDNLYAFNTIDDPFKISPKCEKVVSSVRKAEVLIEPWSVNVIRFGFKN